jgi:uncharacterized protein YjbI with pentapeptide repeats
LAPSQFAFKALLFTDNVWLPGLFTLEFRYFPDKAELPALRQGEAAFFELCEFSGDAVVADHAYDPSALRLGGPSSHKLSSIRLADNTVVRLTTPGGSGVPAETLWIVNDTQCLPGAAFTAPLITSLESVLNGLGTAPFACPKCRLMNTTLSNFDVTGSNWQQADMTGATLSGVQFTAGSNLSGAKFNNATVSNVGFHGSTLTGADFTGAKLTCVDLSGTIQNPRDLTKLTMANVEWLTSNSCSSNLSYTLLSTSILPPSAWKHVNLTGARFVDFKPGMQISTQANPVDLKGAILNGVDFGQVSLDYAVMNSAELIRATLRHCSLRHADLGGAKLFGAHLDNANLDGASLSKAFLNAAPDNSAVAASLVGAFLRNANLAGAQMSGANFTNASFFGSTAIGSCPIASDFTQNCASAARATLNNTVFSNAFLFGVDFSGATIQGVQFGNAVLIGATFNGATLTADSQVGTGSGFPGAFLQGSDLLDAKQLLNISLLNAYLDFSAGNAFTTELSGNHTVFPGWATPGQPVCVQMSYGSGTSAPTNNGTITCPNGSQPSTGCGATVAANTAWKSQVDISASGSYQFDATYTPAAPNQFCQANPSWFTGGLGRVKK